LILHAISGRVAAMKSSPSRHQPCDPHFKTGGPNAQLETLGAERLWIAPRFPNRQPECSHKKPHRQMGSGLPNGYSSMNPPGKSECIRENRNTRHTGDLCFRHTFSNCGAFRPFDPSSRTRMAFLIQLKRHIRQTIRESRFVHSAVVDCHHSFHLE
jgi:hypothetical protein